MTRTWRKHPGRKNSIELPLSDVGTGCYLWTYNKKWLKGFLDKKFITNLEYLEGLNLLKELQNASN